MIATLTISATAAQEGYGSGMHRVRGLTDDERQRAVAGERIFYRAERKSHVGPTGTFWRVVLPNGSSMYPRLPSTSEIEVLRAQTGIV